MEGAADTGVLAKMGGAGLREAALLAGSGARVGNGEDGADRETGPAQRKLNHTDGHRKQVIN